MKLIKFTVLLNLLLLLFTVQASDELLVQKGILDLRGQNLNENQLFKFNGEWEFYWNALLSSADFEQKRSDSISYVTIPSIWANYKINHKTLPFTGAATYRMRILLDSNVNNIAFKLGSYATAFRFFANGQLLKQGGAVSLNKNEAKPGYNPGVVTYQPTIDTIEIIFQISNYDYSKGGFWNSYGRIGNEKQIRKNWNRDVQLSILVIGCILIFAFYHLGLYFMGSNFKYTLYFSLFCLIIVVRSLVTKELFILNLLPNFNWAALIRIEYLTLILGALTFSHFIYKFFNEEYSRLFIKFITIVNILLTILVIFTPVWFFTKFLVVYQVDVLVACFYIVYVVVKAHIRKKHSAKILLIGFFVLVFSLVNDMLHVHRIVDTGLITSYGFLFFVLSQSLMLSNRFSLLIVQSENLAHKLELSNASLEKEVASRTSEIKDQNILLNKQNKEITSSIEYASRIQGAIVDTTSELKKVAPDNFILFKPKDIVSGDFYWFKEIEIKDIKYKIAAVVDCTGHGVPGALMSILGALFLEKVVDELQNNFTAADVLNKMGNEVKSALRQHMDNAVMEGMDMALAIIDYSKNELQFAGASSPLYIIRRNNDSYSENVEEYKGDSITIGTSLNEETAFTNHRININSSDLIYLFSDGYHDQLAGGNGGQPKQKAFKDILLANANLPLGDQKIMLNKELFNFKGKYKQLDDITIVGIRV